VIKIVTNLSNLTRGNQTFYDIVKYTHDVTNDMMGMMFIVVIFVMLISTFMRRNDFESSLLVSSFLCFGLSIIMVSIELLNFWFIFMFGAFMAFSALWIRLSNR